jgi:succinyl-CoA synthetase beta subunit
VAVKVLSEFQAKKLLMSYNIPTTTFELLNEEDGISGLKTAYPLVLKVSSANILHKTEVGGIILDIRNSDELRDKYRVLRDKFPNEQFFIENQEKKGVEVIAGVVDDPAFGKCIMVGIGGIFTEIYQDVSFRMLPIDMIIAEDMLKELRGKDIFYGYRIQVDRNALIDILLKLSIMNSELNIKQLDLNPIFLYEKGAKVIDAKIILEE